MQPYNQRARRTERYNRMCLGKRKFASKSLAEAEGKRIRKKNKTKMIAYYCEEFCTYWHLGHNRTGSQKLFLELTELVNYQRQYGN